MKLTTIFSVISTILIASCSIKSEDSSGESYFKDTSKIDLDSGKGIKVKTYIKGDSVLNTYRLQQFYGDGNLELEGFIENGKEQGTFYWYYKNGNHKWTETYENGISIDTTYCYFKSGKLSRMVINYKDSTDLPFTEFYETGEVKIIGHIHPKGNSYGICRDWTGYYKNGHIKETGFVDFGNKEGEWCFYSEDSSLDSCVDQTGKPKICMDFEEEEIKFQENIKEKDSESSSE